MPTGTPPPPLPSTARVALSGTIWGHRWVNVFYLDITHSGAVTVDDLKTIADGIAAAWSTDVKGILDNHHALTEVKVVFFPTSGTELVYTGSYNHVGTQASELRDAAACIVVDWTISAFYRGGHPRSYVGGVRADQLDNGSDFQNAFLTSATTAFAAFRNAINALTSTNITGVTMGTISKVRDKAYRTTGVFFEYTSVRIRHKLGSQRRRLSS